jgi:ribosomal protein S1
MAPDNFASLMQTAAGVDRAKRRLKTGEVLEANVIQIASDFVFVDVGMPSDGRIPRVDLLDADGKVRVAVGDRIRVSVVDTRTDGPLLKALGQSAPPGEAPKPDEVLKAKVKRIEKFGVFITTPKGDGLIPLRELPLPPGSDHRKLFPPGKELDVVLVEANSQGKLRFSAIRVARVEEDKNFRDFSASAEAEPAAAETKQAPKIKPGFGSLGDLMREKLGAQLGATAKPSASPAAKPSATHTPLADAVPKAAPRSDVLKRKR